MTDRAQIRLRLATLNLRNLADRWDERLPLLLADFGALQPDLIGLQEVVYPMQQDRLLGAAGASAYVARRGWAGRPEYGNAILVRDALVATLEPASATDRADLGWDRSALRVELRLGAASLRFVATHLHHLAHDAAIRKEQVGRLLTWLGDLPVTDATVVVGDFNAPPAEPAYTAMSAAGFRSGFLEAAGAEPEVTWPSGLRSEMPDVSGPAGCLDYVWLAGAVQATAARLCFDRPAVGDPTLYPSDHFGVAVEVTLP
ncbi:MAG TPA: endonuclease/exonuclease/phosphatase family protein [Candidatus Limnocylindrales bacterium]|nr:endonuclease/exonuclease/phosphatase family protein [Candidatus Limnocylindrales bacterium]